MPLFEKVVDYRLYRLDSTAARGLGTQETRTEKQSERLRDVAADFPIFNGYRPITLVEFLKDIRISLNEAYVSKGTALAMFGRFNTKEVGRLYSAQVPGDARGKRTTSTSPHRWYRYGLVARTCTDVPTTLSEKFCTHGSGKNR